MKEIVKPAAILLIITAVAAALLGVVQSVTAPAIAEQSAKTQAEAMKAVLPDADEFKAYEGFEPEGVVVAVNEAYKGGELCGYVINVQPSGFGGIVDTMVGISNDGIIQGMKVLSHSETPGLGAKSTDPSFSDQFKGKKAPLTVIKSGTPGESDIQAITSSTITSKAVTSGVNEAYDWYVNNGGAK